MREILIQKFSTLVLSFAFTVSDVSDKFFVKKLAKSAEDLISCFFKSCIGEEFNREEAIELAKRLNALDDLFENLSHLKLMSPLSFLKIRKNILSFRLELMKQISGTKKKKEPVSVQDKASLILRLEANPNKKKILKFISKSPEVRTKDILSEFSALSRRTVKRNLQELLRDGFLKKLSKDKAMYYSASQGFRL